MMVKEVHSLLDVQGTPDERGIDLDQVGVKNVAIPMRLLQKNGELQSVAASARLSVGLSKNYKGTHLSRFIMQLSEWSRNRVLSLNLREFLTETLERLDVSATQLELTFQYFIEKKAPVSNHSAPMAYDCSFLGNLSRSVSGEESYSLILGLDIPIATLCPCSKAISKYGAHNQRAVIRLRARLDQETEHGIVWIEDLVTLLEECASCPVYPLVKRDDEKYMTERAYENPKFVEDVIRDAILILRNHNGIAGFSLEVEALESIHGHNAWTAHTENMTGK